MADASAEFNVVMSGADEVSAPASSVDASLAAIVEQLKMLNQSADVTNYQLGAMDEGLEKTEETAKKTGMSMTDLKAYPKALKPAFNNNGLSQGMCGSAWLVGKQWKEWEGRLAVGYAGIGIHGTPVGNRIDILDVSKDGMSAKKVEMSYPDYAGRVRHLHSTEGVLYVGDEARGAIFKVTPQ
jgi:hypothetical protein